MTATATRGHSRESELPESAYYSDLYFGMTVLSSFAHQLNAIWSLRPRNVLEIGVGNGFVSSCLKRAGLEVTTADINAALKPDICSPLNSLVSRIHQKFDLVVCCEVLEHMPLEDLDQNLDVLRACGERLFLTLPNNQRFLGIGGLVTVPKLGTWPASFHLPLPFWRKLENSAHFWEVGSSSATRNGVIVEKLKQRYAKVHHGRFKLVHYHNFYSCE
jgi:hypothetical protein